MILHRCKVDKTKDDQFTLPEAVSLMNDVINYMGDKDQVAERFLYEQFNPLGQLHMEEIYFENMANTVYRNLSSQYNMKQISSTFLSSLIQYDVHSLPEAFRISYDILRNLKAQRCRNQVDALSVTVTL